MRSVVKKAAIYSMAGILQLGIGGAVLAAPPTVVGYADQQQVEDKRPGAESNQSIDKGKQANPKLDESRLKDQPETKEEQDQKRLEKLEDQRYKKEIQRRPGESDGEWQKRLQAENERREQNLKQIRQGQ